MRHVCSGARPRAHDHLLGSFKGAVDVDVAAVPAVRDRGEAGIAASVDAQNAVVGGLEAAEVFAVHGGTAGNNPRIVAHVADDPVLGEREVALQRARERGAGGGVHRVVGIRRSGAAGELHRAGLLDVVRAGELNGAIERHIALAPVGYGSCGESGGASEASGRSGVQSELAHGGGGVNGDAGRGFDHELVVCGERAGGRGRPVGRGGDVAARAARPSVDALGRGACDERAGLVIRQKGVVDEIIDAERIV